MLHFHSVVTAGFSIVPGNVSLPIFIDIRPIMQWRSGISINTRCLNTNNFTHQIKLNANISQTYPQFECITDDSLWCQRLEYGGT